MKSKKHIILLLTIIYLAIIYLLLPSSAFAPICPCYTCVDCCECDRYSCIYFRCGCNDPELSMPTCTHECFSSCLDTYSSCLDNCEGTTTTTIPQSTTTTTMPSTTTTIQPTTTTTEPATLITLVSFTATPKAGRVIIEWNTESETSNAGFNLYRSKQRMENISG